MTAPAMMRIVGLSLLLSAVEAQDTSSAQDACAAYTPATIPTSTSIQAVQMTYDSAPTSNCPLAGTGSGEAQDTSTYPSTMAGTYVEVSGVVTAVGTQKDAYSAAYFYMQMTDGSTMFAGVELFKEDHTHSVGDLLTVKGVVREVYGVTEIVVRARSMHAHACRAAP